MSSDDALTAFSRCTAVESNSLGDFLGTLLDEDLETLATMPGTPGQVMAAQFTFYAKSNGVLSEALHRENEGFSRLLEMVQRLPPASKRKRPRAGTEIKEEPK